jgi:hypothetical protein
MNRQGATGIRLLATFYRGDWKRENVRVRVPDPRSWELSPSISAEIDPNHVLSWPRTFDIAAIVGEDASQERIECLECRVVSAVKVVQPHGLHDLDATIEPRHLKWLRRFNRSSEDGRVHTEYRLSPCKWAEPVENRNPSYDGTVVAEQGGTIRVVTFGKVGGCEIVFRYDCRPHESGGYVMTRSLVVRAQSTLDLYPPDAEIDFEAVDDLCWMLSLASRRRVVCLSAERSSTAFMRWHHRSDRAGGDEGVQDELRDHLIPKEFGGEFVQTCIARFAGTDGWTSRIRNAIADLVADEKRDVVAGYVGMFSAMEALLEYCAVESENTRIVGRRVFESIRKQLENTIASLEFDGGRRDDRLAMMCEKLGELNRPSLARIFDAFIQKYQVMYRDLWPVMEGSASLRDIRNRLVHSRHLGGEETQAVVIAKLHLRVFLERCVLALLGWPVSKSDVGPGQVGRAYPDWSTHHQLRKRLEQLWRP